MTDDNFEELKQKEALKNAEMLHAEWIEFHKAVREFSMQGIKMLFTINAGAIVALLALEGHFYDKNPAASGLSNYISVLDASAIYFVVGILFTLLTSGFAYLNFRTFVETLPSGNIIFLWLRGQKFPEVTKFKRRTIQFTAYAGPVCGIISLLFFFAGVYKIYRGLHSL